MKFQKFNNVVIRDEHGEWDAEFEGATIVITQCQIVINNGEVEGWLSFHHVGDEGEILTLEIYDIENGNPICRIP